MMGAWLFVAESVPSKRLALAFTSLTIGLILGILLGAGVVSFHRSQLSLSPLQQYGFFALFFLVGCWGCCTLFVPLVR